MAQGPRSGPSHHFMRPRFQKLEKSYSYVACLKRVLMIRHGLWWPSNGHVAYDKNEIDTPALECLSIMLATGVKLSEPAV